MYILVKYSKLGDSIKKQNKKPHLAVKNLLARELPLCHTACQVTSGVLQST